MPSKTSPPSPETVALVKQIQSKIEHLHEELGWPFVTLARKAGVGITTLDKIRHWPAAPFAGGAEGTSLQLDHVVRLATALGLEIVVRKAER